MRKRKERFVVPKDNKTVHELKLLNGRAVYAVKQYLDYKIDDVSHVTMKKLFLDYRNNKEELIKALKSALKFLIIGRYDGSDPEYTPRCPKPSKEKVKEAKKYLNAFAKKYLK